MLDSFITRRNIFLPEKYIYKKSKTEFKKESLYMYIENFQEKSGNTCKEGIFTELWLLLLGH